jgi:hypothetical protein
MFVDSSAGVLFSTLADTSVKVASTAMKRMIDGRWIEAVGA